MALAPLGGLAMVRPGCCARWGLRGGRGRLVNVCARGETNCRVVKSGGQLPAAQRGAGAGEDGGRGDARHRVYTRARK